MGVDTAPHQLSSSIDVPACDFRQLVERRGKRSQFRELIHRLDKIGRHVEKVHLDTPPGSSVG